MSDKTSDKTSDRDLTAVDLLGVWHELELALAGKNGYSGNITEIYAYRLVPQGLRSPDKSGHASAGGVIEAFFTEETAEPLSVVAGRNMTRLLRRFVELHEDVVIAIEEKDGFRLLDLGAQEVPPFDHRVHLRVTQVKKSVPAPSIHELRAVIAELEGRTGTLMVMLDELAIHRAKERLGADAQEPSGTDDLPPDGATGLYLDRSLDAEDLEWFKMAWDALLRGGSPGQRPTQLMLVFQAIRRDERSTAEFLRVMNTVVLPLLRRLALKGRPQLTKLGGANE